MTVEIDVRELRAHQGRVADVADRIDAAHRAAGAPVGRDAFGIFGYFLAIECADAAAEGLDMLGAAHEAADDHRVRVGVWAGDVDANESDITDMFSTSPELRDAGR
ncbi:hypothetical protein [Actinophytocola oryzae]|uniref:Excreted virulence factor EspC (Type VII ESX diderm) n=1 Tax=Actinophytocola oryzae TaxID=502181 RepID=A0A4R7VFN2_9PSEU|nr:hypothetical protein [Actinophytocola oryzae]TDV47838.1 hypothetical protein CLV71_10973 [Actinophytocola oryzae]